ncbi:MAG: hypothetical protein IJK86_00140 [Lachnospiraceae bacterium]|nr:hypothetical protein [Lachnospiraceae bacterium]
MTGQERKPNDAGAWEPAPVKEPETEPEKEAEKAPDREKQKDRSKAIRRKALGAAAAVTTGTAVLVNGLFGNPDDMLKANDELNKPQVAYYVEEDTEEEETGGEEEEDGEETLTPGLRIKRWIWSWPLALRVLIGLPLWAMGWGVCQAAQLLWKTILNPVLQVLLSILTVFAVLAGVTALAGRALFPELPLREVFKKSRLIALGAGSIVLEIFIALLPAIWKEAEPYAGLIRFGGGALILAGLLLSMLVTKERRKRYVLGLE